MFNKLHRDATLYYQLTYQRPIIKPRNSVIEVYFDPEQTKFNINDYIKLSKKSRRSEKLEDIEKPILQYTMVGKCIFFRRRGINSSFTIRNVINLCPFEMSYPLFSPYLTQFFIVRFLSEKLIRYNRASAYQYRRIAPSKSQIDFDYVTNEDLDEDSYFLDDDGEDDHSVNKKKKKK